MSDTGVEDSSSRSRSRSSRAHKDARLEVLAAVSAVRWHGGKVGIRTAAGSVPQVGPPRPPLGPPPGTPGSTPYAASVAAWASSQQFRLAALVADDRARVAASSDTPAVSAPVLAAASPLADTARDPLRDGQMVSKLADDLHGCFLETLGAIIIAKRNAMDKIRRLLEVGLTVDGYVHDTQREEVGMTEMSIAFLTDMTAAMAPIAKALRLQRAVMGAREANRRGPSIPALP